MSDRALLYVLVAMMSLHIGCSPWLVWLSTGVALFYSVCAVAETLAKWIRRK